MGRLNLLFCMGFLLPLLLVSCTVSGLLNEPTPTIDTTDIEAFHSIDDTATALYAGQNALQNGRYEEALEQYTIATEKDPSWLAPWYLKAYSLEKLNRSQEALIAVDKALTLDPSDHDSNNLKADILEHLGKRKEAAQYRQKEALSQVTAVPPVSPQATQQSPVHLGIIIFGLMGGVSVAVYSAGSSLSGDKGRIRGE
jgi:predicted Zn-dependent protease